MEKYIPGKNKTTKSGGLIGTIKENLLSTVNKAKQEIQVIEYLDLEGVIVEVTRKPVKAEYEEKINPSELHIQAKASNGDFLGHCDINISDQLWIDSMNSINDFSRIPRDELRQEGYEKNKEFIGVEIRGVEKALLEEVFEISLSKGIKWIKWCGAGYDDKIKKRSIQILKQLKKEGKVNNFNIPKDSGLCDIILN